MTSLIVSVMALDAKDNLSTREKLLLLAQKLYLGIIVNVLCGLHKFTHTKVVKTVCASVVRAYNAVKYWVLGVVGTVLCVIHVWKARKPVSVKETLLHQRVSVKKVLKYVAIGIGVVFAVWVMWSIGNVDANNMGVGVVAPWNFFRIITLV